MSPTQCIYCQQNTAGQHEPKCPLYPPGVVAISEWLNPPPDAPRWLPLSANEIEVRLRIAGQERLCRLSLPSGDALGDDDLEMTLRDVMRWLRLHPGVRVS